MEYRLVRQKFVELSGRYDLVIPTTWEDNGADFFINAGQKFLDRMLDSGKTIARYPVIVTAGTFIVKSVGIRAIQEVWCANADGKTQLNLNTLQQIRTEYSEEFSSVDQGQPEYYAPAVLRPYPDTLASATGMYNVSDLLLYNATAPSQHFSYNGIVIMPPADGTYTIEILGLFYSPTLSATVNAGIWTQTMSFWTEIHPDVLIEAAIYKLHTLYNNTGAAADYKVSVIEDMMGIDHDAAQEDIGPGGLQMGG